MEEKQVTVAVLGASPKPERYANKATRLLLEHGYNVIPINPAYDHVEGLKVVPVVEEIASGSVDTVTVYMRPERTSVLGDALKELKPRRVIFNPGTENEELMGALAQEDIEVVEACTLVLLNTGQF